MKMRTAKSMVAVGIVLLVLAAWIAGCFESNRTKVIKAIRSLRLAKLPTSATNISFHRWSGLFTGETYAKVQMTSNDLATFIANSSSLADGEVEYFTPEHQHLPLQKANSQSDYDHAYFSKSPRSPIWFDLTITNKGRCYSIWPDKRVFFNEDTGTLYLHIIKG